MDSLIALRDWRLLIWLRILSICTSTEVETLMDYWVYSKFIRSSCNMLIVAFRSIPSVWRCNCWVRFRSIILNSGNSKVFFIKLDRSVRRVSLNGLSSLSNFSCNKNRLIALFVSSEGRITSYFYLSSSTCSWRVDSIVLYLVSCRSSCCLRESICFSRYVRSCSWAALSS